MEVDGVSSVQAFEEAEVYYTKELTLSLRESLSDALSQLVRVLAKAVSDARDVSEVTHALHSFASLLFSYHLEKTSGNGAFVSEVTEHALICQEQALQVSSNGEWRNILKLVFYQGSLFPIVARILLFSVAPDWLACFSSAEQIYLFDVFFTSAPPSLVITELVRALEPAYDEVDCGFPAETSFSCKAVERLLVLCLFENNGFRKMVLESAKESQHGGPVSRTDQSLTVLAQIIASIPDKARPDAPVILLSPQFHLSATLHFLEATEEYWITNYESLDICKTPFVFSGELFARLCRRGHADVVASQILSKLLNHTKHCGIVEPRDLSGVEIESSEHNAQSSYWTALMECMKDVYAVERLVKALLKEMSEKQIKDMEAYYIFCILFSKLLESQSNIRSLFTKKVLFWTHLPICCLRWILQFAVFCRPPPEAALNASIRFSMDKSQIHIIRQLVEVWAEEKFIQSAEMQEHTYITWAICFSLRFMTKKDLECSENFLQLLLQGISCRLASPLHLVRLMAKKVALAFSLVVDQTNPLLLDEDDKIEDLCDWELLDSHRPSSVITNYPVVDDKEDSSRKNKDKAKDPSDAKNGTKKNKKAKHVTEAYDPDEVIDLRTYVFSDADGSGSSDSESTCSLEPYDLSDDESDLHRDKLPMHLRDCAANLRKGDEPDLVEKALEVVEKLVRAMPEELDNAAADLAHALIHVRCSDVAVEGQEQSAEKKRYDALVALLACAPLTVDVFTQTLYSPHVDVSQRLLILEVMSDAAKEIATSGPDFEDLSLHGHNRRRQIMEIDKTWYGPGGTSTLIGAGPWKKIHEPDAMVSLIHKYERELPQSQESSKALGKSRRWGHRSMQLQRQQRDQSRVGNTRKNNFVSYVPSFMLPVMRDYDKKQHGVDLIGRDFIVLGRLICMLGVCIECVSLQPEACILAAGLLNMLRSRQISGHAEAYIRRATLYAISRIMMSLHPSHVMNAINGGDEEIASGLDWIHTWALKLAEDDSDHESSSMAMACLHIHSELILRASRLLEPQQLTGGNSISYKYGDSHKISLF